mmetsp:Transcript_7554/g.14067  ORF Transcript_7554/g.14067 Transcript_7554/m.14067 type:complete len:278 (-) Transcript_7554:326-1159(-)
MCGLGPTRRRKRLSQLSDSLWITPKRIQMAVTSAQPTRSRPDMNRLHSLLTLWPGIQKFLISGSNPRKKLHQLSLRLASLRLLPVPQIRRKKLHQLASPRLLPVLSLTPKNHRPLHIQFRLTQRSQKLERKKLNHCRLFPEKKRRKKSRKRLTMKKNQTTKASPRLVLPRLPSPRLPSPRLPSLRLQRRSLRRQKQRKQPKRSQTVLQEKRRIRRRWKVSEICSSWSLRTKSCDFSTKTIAGISMKKRCDLWSILKTRKRNKPFRHSFKRRKRRTRK